MSSPVDIIAAAIREAELAGSFGSINVATVAVGALTDPAIVDNAVQALIDDAWEETPSQTYTISREDLANIARTVLRSVGGA